MFFRYYRYARRSANYCSGSIKKLADGTIIVNKPHNGHPPQNNVQPLVKIFRETLKRRAATENQLLKLIYDEESRRNPDASSHYPWPTAESSMRLARRNSLPPLPSSFIDLASLFDDQRLQRFECCNEILFKGCIHDIDGRASIIFSCKHLIELVMTNDIQEVHVDATFKVVPANMGKQLLSIHCMIENYSIPVVYCLMESKSRNSYECVLNFIKTHLLLNLNPSIILTDFEPALRDTLSSVFPNARTVGCWFHHNQAVWKNMKKKGFLQLINSNEFALKALRMLLALPLLPSGDIQRAFEVIRMFALNHRVPMVSLFNYYQNFWLRQVGVDVLSVNGLPRRTNNNLESFHNNLRIKFSVYHPNLWIFLNHLCNLSSNYHNVVSQLANNLRPTRNYRVRFNSARIRHASEQYSSGLISMWQFLQRCSFSTATYEQQQRNWALNVAMENADELPNQPAEALADQLIEQPINNIVPVVDQVEIEPLIDQVEIEPLIEPPVNPPSIVNPETENTCMTCLLATMTESDEKYIIIPCGHAWMCATCMINIQHSDPIRCPVCRQNNIQFQRLYFS